VDTVDTVDTVDASTLGYILSVGISLREVPQNGVGHLAKRSTPKKVQFNSLSQNTSDSFKVSH